MSCSQRPCDATHHTEKAVNLESLSAWVMAILSHFATREDCKRLHREPSFARPNKGTAVGEVEVVCYANPRASCSNFTKEKKRKACDKAFSPYYSSLVMFPSLIAKTEDEIFLIGIRTHRQRSGRWHAGNAWARGADKGRRTWRSFGPPHTCQNLVNRTQNQPFQKPHPEPSSHLRQVSSPP